MEPGGIENWLMNLLRVFNRDLFQIDFLFHTTKASTYDEEILDLGSNILRCPWPKRPLKYSRNLKKLIKKYGPYNVIHSHVHHFSGWVLRSAYQAGIPIRIAHSHSNISTLISQSSWIRKVYYIYMKHLVKRCATDGIAVSKPAAGSLFGSKWETDSRWQIIHCGINTDLFEKSIDQSAVRRKLGIPSGSLVVGHAGRFSEEKNHLFIINVFFEIIRKMPSVRLLLVGDGENLIKIKKLAQKKGLYNKIIFTGLRNDVVDLMLGAMDIFLFPSIIEGLPLAIIEAQAAGLPCILSEHIPCEAEIVPPLIYRMPLSESAGKWAETIFDIRQMKKREIISQKDSLQMVLNSSFNLEVGKLKLESIYKQE
jgi:glycosyltransferase involved in cell wall biosynthesis